MKTKRIVMSARTGAVAVLAAMLLGFSTASRGDVTESNATVAGATAVVTFVHPEKFTDVKVTDYTLEQSRAILLPKIEKVIQEETKKRLPAGERLDVKILDVDEAGEPLPAGLYSTRTVTENLPARVELEFTLTDTSGTVRKSGHRTLSRLIDGFNEAQARYDSARTTVLNEMLRDWVSSLAKH